MYKPNSVLFSYSRVAKERSLYCQATGVPKHLKYLVCENKDFPFLAGKALNPSMLNIIHLAFRDLVRIYQRPAKGISS